MLFGSLGNDEQGRIAIDSLTRHGIDVSYLKYDENISTNIMNIIIPNNSKLGDDNVIFNWYSPITNTRTFFFNDNLPINIAEELKTKEIYILLDKFENINLQFLNNIEKKKVCLDVGHVRFIEHFTKQYLIMFFKNANLMQLNNNVSQLLFERLQIKDEYKLFNILNLDLLVITKGKKGAQFIFKDNDSIVSIDKSPEIIAEVVDSTGAGDAFFASIIKEYAYCNKIDSKFIDITFRIANKASRDVISQVGGRRF